MAITLKQLDYLVSLKIQAESAAETFREALKQTSQDSRIKASSLRSVVAAMTAGKSADLEETAGQILALLSIEQDEMEIPGRVTKSGVILSD